MVLAAGFGTRLGALTHERPKPMLPVCGTPLVEWAVRWLRHHGIRDVVVNLHHLGEQIEATLGDGTALGMRVRYTHEEGQILGTGGGLRNARPLLDDGSGREIVVVNAKILVDLDLAQVLALHRRRASEATMVLRADPNAARWGSLRIGADDRIVELLTRRRDGEELLHAGDPLMFTGIHVLSPRFLDRIPPEGEQCVIRTAYRELFDEGGALHAFETRGYWWEHSTPARYLAGVKNVLDGAIEPVGAPGPVRGVSPDAAIHPSAEIRSPVWIGPGARVGAGARVGPHVELGAGASVAPGVTLERAIVWDGVHVAADAADAVIGLRGRVSALEP
jgi:mannose-1-phosphate guanylyltransferase